MKRRRSRVDVFGGGRSIVTPRMRDQGGTAAAAPAAPSKNRYDGALRFIIAASVSRFIREST
jgi:hypothetical protein